MSHTSTTKEQSEAWDAQQRATATVPHSHYIVVAEQLEKRSEELEQTKKHLSLKLTQEQEIRRLLESAGLTSVLEEQGSCMKRSMVDHIRLMVDWQKDVQKVRDALRKELERLGYTDAQLRELCGLPVSHSSRVSHRSK